VVLPFCFEVRPTIILGREVGGQLGPLGEHVDPLEYRQLKMPFDGLLGAKSSATKRVAEMQEYVTHFAMQATEATKTLAIFGRLHALDALGSLGLEPVGYSSISSAIGKLVLQ
jgi:hypothetical protein